MKIFNADEKVVLHMREELGTLIIWTGFSSHYLDEKTVPPRSEIELKLEIVPHFSESESE